MDAIDGEGRWVFQSTLSMRRATLLSAPMVYEE